MGKPIGLKQGLQGLMSLGVNVDWDQVDSDLFQRTVVQNPVEAGRQFTAFLKNGGRVLISEPKIIQIDRSKLFDPSAFIGQGWSIIEEDERSLALTDLDLSTVRFEHMLKQGETHVKGEKKLERLKVAAHVRLDARIFQTLWENQYLIPESWKEKTNGTTTFVSFDGTILQDALGRRYVLDLDWCRGEWHWDVNWLEGDWGAGDPSVVAS